MLQQTQTKRVIEKYNNFISVYPKLNQAAQASFEDILRLWQGLGYNKRALHLYKTIQIIINKYNGIVPYTYQDLVTLPGIGDATAGAILAYAFNKPSIFIETNIRTTFFYLKFKKNIHITDTKIKSYITSYIDRKKPRLWYYAVVDYGNYLKTKGVANTQSAHYTKQSKFIGSNRQIRGLLIFYILNSNTIPFSILIKKGFSKDQITKALDSLIKDNILVKNKKSYKINTNNENHN